MPDVVLVTGACGYVGRHLVFRLISLGHKVVLVDNFENSRRESSLDWISSLGPNAFFHEGCFGNISLLKELRQDYRFDGVFHLAAKKSINESIEKPVDYYLNNVSATFRLLETLGAYVDNFIFSSTAAIYQSGLLRCSENDPLIPTSPYGNTKLVTEMFLKDYFKESQTSSCVALRYFNPIGWLEACAGPRQKSTLGVTHRSLFDALGETLLRDVDEITIHGDRFSTKDGTAIRDFFHISGLVEAHVAAYNYCKNNRGFQEFNVGSGQGFSVKEVVDSFKRLVMPEVGVVYGPQRDGDLPEVVADTSKAYSLLRWSASKTLAEIMTDSFC